jgi:hypothetical protein
MSSFYNISIILLCAATLAFAPVKQTADRYARFKTWYEANHARLRQKQDVAALTYQLTYSPTELAVLREIKDRPSVSNKELRALYADYTGQLDFNFRIETREAADFLLSQSVDQADYNDKIYYLISNIQDDFRLVQGTDTLAPFQCKFENNYGTAPFVTLHLLFENPDRKFPAHATLIYRDSLFGAGNLFFDLQATSQLHIPKIK